MIYKKKYLFFPLMEKRFFCLVVGGFYPPPLLMVPPLKNILFFWCVSSLNGNVIFLLMKVPLFESKYFVLDKFDFKHLNILSSKGIF